MPSAAHVVSFDLEAVGVDLSAIPMEEILSFRAEYREQYRKYAHDLKRFVREVAELPIEDQQGEMQARQAEIVETAAKLRTAAQGAWKRPLAFSLGVAGAAWMIKSGDIIGGLLALGAGLAGAQPSTSAEAGVYSYLFDARKRFN